jgi:hypothetical protein
VIVIAKPHDTVIVQVPASWTPSQVMAEQERIAQYVQDESHNVRVLIVPGGEERSASHIPSSFNVTVKHQDLSKVLSPRGQVKHG